MTRISLGELIRLAPTVRAGAQSLPVLSMTMHGGLVNQVDKFKKRVASHNTSQYKVVRRNQLVVGFPIDEGVLAFQNLHDAAVVSPAYGVWDILDDAPVEAAYLERFLRSTRALSYYKSKLRSTTARRRSLAQEDFLSLAVPLPTLTEQKRIVGVLNEVDALARLRREADKRSAALIPALFHEMFERAASAHPSKALSEVCEFITKGATPGASEILLTPDSDSVPFLKVHDLGDDGAVRFGRTPSFVTRALHEGLLSRSRVRPSDVLMNIVGPPLGKIAIVPEEYPEWNVNQAIAIFRAKPGLNPVYLLHALRMPEKAAEIVAQAVGVRQLNLSLEQCRRVRIPVPPVAHQDEFVSRVREIELLQRVQNATRASLKTLREAVTHWAFSDTSEVSSSRRMTPPSPG